ncbi:MAG: cytochrome c [Planctomycetota bacterium]|nr:cytochrome c [Planctomycetota bacterium]
MTRRPSLGLFTARRSGHPRSAARVAALCLAALLPRCGSDPEPDPPAAPPPAAPPADVVEGRTHFQGYCSPCHHPEGRGIEDGPPPLVGSSWVAGPESRLVRIVLHGVRGTIEVSGKTYSLEMPGFGTVLTDAQVASILSFVRRRFGEPSPPVLEATVSRVRAATRDRTRYWTAQELLAAP